MTYPHNKGWVKQRITLTGKMCKRCKVFKPIDEFHLRTLSRDGHQASCKECIATYNHLEGKGERIP